MAILQLVSITIVLATTFLIRRHYYHGLNRIPAPFGASLSIAWQVWHVIKGDLEWESIQLHRKHGHFVRLSYKEVSVSHPDGIKAILLAPLRKADWYKVMALPDHRYQTPMSEVDPKRSVSRMKNIAAAFTLTNLIKAEKHMDKLIQLFHTKLSGFADDGTPVEFNKWFNYLAFDIIGEMTFSSSFGFVESGTDIGGAIENTRVLTLYTALAGFFYGLHRMTLGNPLVTKLGLMPSQHIFDTTLRAINKRRDNPEVRFDMLEHWKQVRAQYPDRMEENELYGVTNMAIGAGADTISASLQALFYYLIRYPQHYAKVKTEVRKANTSKVIAFSETQNLPFLQACIKEAQRMHPAVAWGLPRVVPEGGLKIGDKFFPAGTILSVNSWVYHRSKDYFGEDADEFNPERWLQPSSKELEKYYIPFGAGYNSCVGRNLAMIELHKISATVLRDFEIRQVDPKKSWEYESHFTAVPYDWPCIVSKRAD